NLALLSKIAGVVIIVAGLHFLGMIHLPILHREARYHADARPVGLVGAYLIGLAFAFGWTPCIGPVLAAILLMAAGEDTVRQGFLLLTGILFLTNSMTLISGWMLEMFPGLAKIG